MVKLGPIMEEVPFAWDAASSLRLELIRAADELEGQISGRERDGRDALEEWRGRYAREFEHEHLAITAGDARRIAAELRRCAEMLGELAELARQEEERREVAREWQREHRAWERRQADDSGLKNLVESLVGDGEPKPPEQEEIKPQPLVATAPPVRHRG